MVNFERDHTRLGILLDKVSPYDHAATPEPPARRRPAVWVETVQGIKQM